MSPIPENIQKILVTPHHPLYGACSIWRPHYWHKCLNHKIPRRSYNSKKNEDLAKRYLIVFFDHKTLLFTRFVSEKFYTLKKVSSLNMWKIIIFPCTAKYFFAVCFIYLHNQFWLHSIFCPFANNANCLHSPLVPINVSIEEEKFFSEIEFLWRIKKFCLNLVD